MHRRWNLGALLAALVLSAGGVAKADVIARVNGGTAISPDQNNVMVVNLGEINGTVLVHIYDDDLLDGHPDQDLNGIHITGTLGTDPRIHLLVARSTQTSFPSASQTTLPIATGIRYFGTDDENRASITFSSNDLRDVTELAMAVSGDIFTGTFEVGRVYRVQASGSTVDETFIGGTIDGGGVASPEVSPVPPPSASAASDGGALSVLRGPTNRRSR